MKKFLAILLSAVMLLSGCAAPSASSSSSVSSKPVASESVASSEVSIASSTPDVLEPEMDSPEAEFTDVEPNFDSLNSPELLQYMQDRIYAGLVDDFQSEDYIIDNVSAIYLSKEYLEEVAYNSKANIYFGYTLEELDEQFQGARYEFTLGDDGTTQVQKVESCDNYYEQVIKNVVVGSGVILVCATVSVISGGAGAPAVSVIFATSAKTGAIAALSSGVLSGVAAGAVEGFKSKDFDKAIKAASLKGSESFKFGAIVGALSGGIGEACALKNSSVATKADGVTAAPSPVTLYRKAELTALKHYGGKEQLTYLGGKEVPLMTPGATRPDVCRMLDGHLEAIEVKCYNLQDSGSRGMLIRELKRQVAERIENLPAGSTQRICLNVQDRGFSNELVSNVVDNIHVALADIYPNIPIDIMG